RLHRVRERGGRRARGAGARRRAPDRLRQPAARRAFALPLAGQGRGRARSGGADEVAQAGLGGAPVAALGAPSVPGARVRRGAHRGRRAEVHGVARSGARAGGGRGGAADARLVLGIETSCDDTSVAVLEDGRRLRSHLIAGQDVHRLYGGVVPERASRAHLELLPKLVSAALEEADAAPGELTAIAVTRAPALVGS